MQLRSHAEGLVVLFVVVLILFLLGFLLLFLGLLTQCRGQVFQAASLFDLLLALDAIAGLLQNLRASIRAFESVRSLL